MCGIAGFTRFNKKNYDATIVIEQMCNKIAHRGPDGYGYENQEKISLGHRRLSIVDLEGGAQPIYNPNNNSYIVFNGEIYNYKKLQKELKLRNYELKTSSDTEVVLALYEIHGLDFLQYLEGMFAIAIWDQNKEKLILAKDRMGEKPIYYHIKDGDIVFSSELKSIVTHPEVPRIISPEAFNKFLTYEYIPSPHTILKNIHKVEAGEIICFDKNGATKNFYWNYPSHNHLEGDINFSKDELVHQLDELLRTSIETRLMADVPVGVLLSGGIDSSLVTAIASEFTDKLQSFSIYFNEKSYDESNYIKKITSKFSLNHHSEYLSSKDMVSIFDKLGNIMDEPMADPSIVPTYFLSKMTSKKVKTVLGGDGADEIFAGYPTYTANKLIQAYNVIPFEIRTSLTNFTKSLIGKAIPVSNNNISLDFKLKQFFRGANVASEVRFFRWMGGFIDQEKRDVINKDFLEQSLSVFPYEDINRLLSRVNILNETDRLLYLSQKMYLMDDILVKTDRASMQNSLEIRAPFLDHNIVEFAAALPSRFKLRGLKTKYILKELALKYIPSEIVNRPKKGFGIPITEWLKNDLKEPMMDLLSKKSLDKDGILNYQGVNTLIKEHLEGSANNRKLIWTLLTFQLWNREFNASI
jgi:asparagine synthase (glutamine-hydrolysing)